LHTGKPTLEELDQFIIDELYDTGHFESNRLKVHVPLPAIEHVLLRNHNKSGLAVYDDDEKIIRRVTKKSYLPVIYSRSITPTQQCRAKLYTRISTSKRAIALNWQK